MNFKIMSAETQRYMKVVYDERLNIYSLLNRLEKNVSDNMKIPEIVIQNVCKEYLKCQNRVESTWPWFIQVFVRKSREYFNEQCKSQNTSTETPNRLKSILKNL